MAYYPSWGPLYVPRRALTEGRLWTNADCSRSNKKKVGTPTTKIFVLSTTFVDAKIDAMSLFLHQEMLARHRYDTL